MTNRAENLDDSVQWVNRDAILYTEGEFAVLVWVTSEPGLFRRRRVIQSSSLLTWDVGPEHASCVIEPWQREKIIAELRRYFLYQKIRCSVE